jgi:hypothetical protein
MIAKYIISLSSVASLILARYVSLQQDHIRLEYLKATLHLFDVPFLVKTFCTKSSSIF